MRTIILEDSEFLQLQNQSFYNFLTLWFTVTSKSREDSNSSIILTVHFSTVSLFKDILNNEILPKFLVLFSHLHFSDMLREQ